MERGGIKREEGWGERVVEGGEGVEGVRLHTSARTAFILVAKNHQRTFAPWWGWTKE